MATEENVNPTEGQEQENDYTILLKVQEIMLRVPIIPYRPMDMPKHIAE